jgi:hypothetical protein
MLTIRPRRLLPLALAALGACAAFRGTSSGPRWQENGRVARNLPTMFVADTTNRAAQPTLGGGCTVRLVDPRDGTLLVLVRSQQLEVGRAADVTRSPTRDNIPPTRPAQPDVRGDYSVDFPERYGVAPGELLRLDCVTGRALGIVGRGD